jgi:hypothetical protein
MTPIRRLAALLALSILLGVACGIVSGVAAVPLVVTHAAAYGAIAGLFVSPFFVSAVWHRAYGGLGAAIIIPACLLAAAVGGLVTPQGGGPMSPLIGLAISTSACIITSILFSAWSHLQLIDQRDGPEGPLCESCGYSLRGLPDVDRCPECGKPTTNDRFR